MRLPWLIYIKERFPLPVYLLLTVGMAWQGQLALSTDFNLAARILGPVMLLVFFFCLRLMDEVKDYKKDLTAHPERPLPRGLIQVATAKKVIGFTLALQIFFGIGLLAADLSYAGYFWIMTTVWLYLMYVEFYCGAWLEQRPFFYATTHQLILLPLILSAAHLMGDVNSRPAIWSGVMILGAFFTYEIARKLDPKAHELLRTYRLVYGRRGALALMVFTSAVAMAGVLLKTGGSLSSSWPYILVVIGTWIGCALWGEEKPKAAEGLASVSLLVHIWGPVITALVSSGKGAA
ncbi:UbiA family prenyltransferase [Oligoflexus tunisiensis]|uniref:UbiA family prenyltransferase n=1 Tax=Oligoflexus tunisiensis TaxID=708132 RepID=UPI00114CB95E|nr:UbiA family prenyltransferase [Oligoflexus tunisiensis]